jgi:hypothetical protein
LFPGLDAQTGDPGSCYRIQALAQIPRLLSNGDREPLSATFGCFDRSFWAWKFTDFAGSRFQESVYALAHLHSAEGSPYHGKLLPWLRAGLAFWCRLQNPDGSFDEAYPFEHSLAATSFTTFYLGEACRLIGHDLPREETQRLKQTFARAGDWLCRNDERHGILSNHLAAAAAGLAQIAFVTEDERYARRSTHFLTRILDHQSREGWYEEYGGADPGYQTHGTFYLARLWQLTNNATVLESLARSLAFLKHFIHPNGTLGGEYGSRNTEFYFPAGFEMLAPQCADAAAIAHFMRPAVSGATGAGLETMDRYNFLPMLNNYLFAADAAQANRGINLTPQSLPCESEGEWYFPDAGLLVRSTPSYYAVSGLAKGGVLKVYDRRTRKLAISDCGYWVSLGGRTAGSQGLNRRGSWTVQDGRIEVSAALVEANQRVMSPWLFVAFRLFSLTLGRLQRVAYWVKNLIVRVLVQRRRTIGMQLIRRIVLESDRVSVVDTLTNPLHLRVEAVFLGKKFSTIHMGSARYFQLQELDAAQLSSVNGALDALSRGEALRRSQQWSFE